MLPAKPRTGRLLKFVCLHNEGVRVVQDLGYTRDGTPTGQRQAILRMLDKVSVIDGRRVQTFLLAEAPTEEFSEHDPLDRQLRTQAGEWQLPSPAWLALRAKRLEEQQRLADEASEKALHIATNNLSSQLGKLMQQASAPTAAPVRGGSR
jgi:hypothetical protein